MKMLTEETNYTELLTPNNIIGKGKNSEVYKISKDRVVKLFHIGFSMQKIEKEYIMTKKAYTLGIPTAKTYDIITDNNDRLGIEYEYIHGTSLNKDFLYAVNNNDKCKIDLCIRNHFEIMKYCHSINIEDESFEDPKDIIINNLMIAYEKKFFSYEELHMIAEFLNTIPNSNGFIHGDFNLENVISTVKGLKVVDIGSCMKGSFLYDIIKSGLIYNEIWEILPKWFIRRYSAKRVGMSLDQVLFFWNKIKLHYNFGKTYNEQLLLNNRLSCLSILIATLSLSKMIDLPHDLLILSKRKLLQKLTNM